MNVIFYIIIFCIGVVIGSFCAKAIYRVPKKINLIFVHSFCPSCNKRLEPLETIPILSYIFLKGKCKHCKQKISPMYFVTEFLTGIIFVLIAVCLNLNLTNFSVETLIDYLFIIFYIITMIIIAGIDKNNRKIEKVILYIGMIISCTLIMYICVTNESSVYKYVSYLIALIILLMLDSERQINYAESSYLYENLMLIVVMLINTNEIIVLISIVLVFLSIAIYRLFRYLKNALNKARKEEKSTKDKYKYGFLFSVVNLILFIGNLMAVFVMNS